METVVASDLAFVIGIPTSKAEFYDALDDARREFVRCLCRSWPKYASEIVEPFERFARAAKTHGVHIVPGTRGAMTALTAGRFKAIILFSHWSGQELEFIDGLSQASEIVTSVREGFDGVIDLTACRPLKLAQLLARDRPTCLIKYARPVFAGSSEAFLTPAIWLAFYTLLVQIIAKEPMPYTSALVECARLITLTDGG